MTASTCNFHTFHIPIMGTGFTIDTPLYVARFGISSVVSLVDDDLIEQMRKYHTQRIDEPFQAVSDREEDSRAKRITLYLNLLDRLVKKQTTELRALPFTDKSEIEKYFELLPDTKVKQLYLRMRGEREVSIKAKMQDELRNYVIPGSIDVNIMTKVDKDNYFNHEKRPLEFSDALSALRGYAQSNLGSSIVFSAGMNKRLYSYISSFDDFFPDPNGNFKKEVILKVSDFRSAEIQGRFLAKRGIWVSEFRIESGLNCGGHAFATVGSLIGPILEEFKNRRQELIEKLFIIYKNTLSETGRYCLDEPPKVKVTMQGGIGSCEESEFLLDYYNLDATGWGSPFLLVPEVTNVDNDHLNKLVTATEEDIFLSNSSPLGIPFWNLKNSESENARRNRIREGRPGSKCPKGLLKFENEFSETTLCSASHGYQRKKLQSLVKEDLSPEAMNVERENILAKSCLCHDLAGSVYLKIGIDPNAAPAICSGPNIAYFSQVATLEEMVGHIYGRLNLLKNSERPHMFIKELSLYIDYYREEINKSSLKLSNRKQKYFDEFKENLRSGIEYYINLKEKFIKEDWNNFKEDLKSLCDNLDIPDFEPVFSE